MQNESVPDAWTKILLLFAMCLAVLVLAFVSEWTFHLLSGWVFFIFQVLPRTNVRWDGVAFFSVGIVICIVCTQWFVSWLITANNPHSAKRWRWSHSVALVCLFLMLFVITTAMAGITHQVGWLINSPVANYTSAIQSLEDNALSNYRIGEVNSAAPATNWIADTGPFLPCVIEVDRKKPWNDPANLGQYKKINIWFLNPRAAMPLRSPDGLGLSHFAGNAAVLRSKQVVRAKEIQIAETLLVGEVNQALEPWGMPGNCRSATHGLNLSRKHQSGDVIGFGPPLRNDVTLFGMLDGSVRHLSPDIDPEVLRQLGVLKPAQAPERK